jgi:hypothetical protein
MACRSVAACPAGGIHHVRWRRDQNRIDSARKIRFPGCSIQLLSPVLTRLRAVCADIAGAHWIALDLIDSPYPRMGLAYGLTLRTLVSD